MEGRTEYNVLNSRGNYQLRSRITHHEPVSRSYTMTATENVLEQHVQSDYKWGFITDIEADSAPPGLNEEIVRFISAKKGEPEWLLEWRLKAYRKWITMEEPHWPNVHYPPIDYQDSI